MARQLTVRGVDARLQRSLQSEAKRRRRSINRTVLELLEEATGLGQKTQGDKRPGRFNDLDHLAGTWTEAEADEFDAYLRHLRQVEPELWR